MPFLLGWQQWGRIPGEIPLENRRKPGWTNVADYRHLRRFSFSPCWLLCFWFFHSERSESGSSVAPWRANCSRFNSCGFVKRVILLRNGRSKLPLLLFLPLRGEFYILRSLLTLLSRAMILGLVGHSAMLMLGSHREIFFRRTPPPLTRHATISIMTGESEHVRI